MTETTEPPQPPEIRRRMAFPRARIAFLIAIVSVPVLAATREPSETLLMVGRIAIVYAALTFAFRTMGKRELSQLSPFELITLMLIPEILSQGMAGESSLLISFVGLCTLFLLVTATSVLAHRFRKFSMLIEPEPTVLVADGRIRVNAMNEERVQPEELFSEMHKHGYRELSEIKWAILESGGDIAFIPAGRRPEPHTTGTKSRLKSG